MSIRDRLMAHQLGSAHYLRFFALLQHFASATVSVAAVCTATADALDRSQHPGGQRVISLHCSIVQFAGSQLTLELATNAVVARAAIVTMLKTIFFIALKFNSLRNR